VYGKGVRIFKRNGDAFIDIYNDSYQPYALYRIMASDREYDCCIIQELLKSHPELIRLSGTETLQTIRLFTYVDSRGHVHIQHAGLKVVVGKNVIDNSNHGATGNLQAKISQEGMLHPAVRYRADGIGIQTLVAHPDTGISFEGFRIPYWEKVCRLAREQALRFLPLRQIGWDMAVTPDRVIFVEGNRWGDFPDSYQGTFDGMISVIQSDQMKFNAKEEKVI
jgi:hypothetical protein